MREIADELRAWRRDEDPVAIATVVETWGSSPRPLGSKMLVSASGRMAGSVSNGCIEGAVFEEAQKVLKTGEPKLAAFGVADDVAFEVCRGRRRWRCGRRGSRLRCESAPRTPARSWENHATDRPASYRSWLNSLAMLT